MKTLLIETVADQAHDLTQGNIYKVIGSGTTFTYQSVGDGSVSLLGSNDQVHWNEIALFTSTISTPDCVCVDHSWLYLKVEVTGTAKLLASRG